MTSQDQQGRPVLPEQRSGRHAAPRTPVRVRLRGRALAMAAVPTALLMAAAYTPNPAIAEPAAGKPCASAPESVPDVTPVEETPVPKSELTPPPGPSTAPTGAAATAPTTAPTGAPTAGAPTTAPTAPAPTTPAAPAATTAPVKPTGAATQPPAVRSGATGGQGGVVQAGLIDDLIGGVTNLIHPSASPSASAAPSAAAGARAAAPQAPAPQAVQTQPAQTTAAPQAPAPGATTAAQPTGTAQSTGAGQTTPSPKASTGGRATPKATPSAGATATPSATGTPTANPNCDVDARGLTAGAAAPGHVVPEQNWTLKSSRLGLHGAAFHGVYDVRTPTGTKRVLKFVVNSVDIENLDMSTLEGNGKTFHVKGAPGSTSTMRNGQVTMYVERLSGHLSKVLGLPVPIDLGEITLTPDTLPRWLYDLIGAIPIPLDLELTGVTAKQAGQFGGTLKIPGMKMYNDDEPYSDK
ncbi:hypothetical protein J5Y04_08990 [Kitasatospora sp. RG8]|uniref:hypothetical protein n=1 Tax=Kitasatospora sp. RG8 TaxID=2820815 RepID=UPI001ADED163|nr:hypothetical protein [Kitasatospora sp. RG8]MBP0449687.1 hypothetical protein [Kitasatospora sp. RG8]